MKTIAIASLKGVLLGLLLAAVAPAADAARPIAEVLQPFVDRQELAGAVVLVADRDKILDLSAVGYADVNAKAPMKTDALFWIASQSKAMTAAGLMMLVDEGKVNVEDPVAKYLPEFGNPMVVAEQDGEHLLLKKANHLVTVHEVLSHISGLPFMSRPEEIPHKIDSLTLKEAGISYGLTPLRTQPGTHFEYSNAGINTAGRIIEAVSGMPYEKFMQQRLFDPLEMKDTTCFPSPAQLQRLAKSYRPGPDKKGLVEQEVDQLSYPLTRPDRYPSPAGGYFSTATDVAHFCQMLLNGGTYQGKRLLSDKAVQQMTSTQTGDIMNKGQGENGYGFGLFTSRKPTGDPRPGSGGTFGHGGAYSTDMSIDPSKNLIRVFLVQAAGFPGNGNQALGTFHKAAEAYAMHEK